MLAAGRRMAGAAAENPGDAVATRDDEPRAGDDDPAAGGGASRRGRRWWLALAGGAALAVAVVAAAALRQPPPRPEGLVILYGDSLSVEAAGDFVRELERTSDAEVVTRPVPGLSPCDALDTMRADLALEPAVVVIQYVGNNASPCMLDGAGQPLTGQALTDRIEADVRTAAELFAMAGTRVVLVGGPHAPGLPAGDATLDIAETYLRIVNEWAGELGRIRYADAAATVTGPDHRYADRLPCRDGEGPDEGCADGEVVVRSPDRIHFCPTEHDGLACPVPSPGARRFGHEMARVTRMALDPDY